jgi:hypothetical protein
MRDKVDDLCGNSIHLTGQVEGFENSLQRGVKVTQARQKNCVLYFCAAICAFSLHQICNPSEKPRRAKMAKVFIRASIFLLCRRQIRTLLKLAVSCLCQPEDEIRS